MIASAVLKLATKQNFLTIAKLQLPSPTTYQQIRFARKTFKLRHKYGLKPLHTDDDFEQARESGQLEDLAYQEIRFPQIWETNSPFFDPTRDQYLRFMMFNGRRGLMDKLLHETFYEIKTIQIKRLRKQKERDAKMKDSAKQSSDPLNDEKEEEIITDPMILFKKAIDNCKPVLVTKKIRRGGAVYQVPYPVTDSQSVWLAMRWLNTIVKERPKPRKIYYHEALAQEVIDAAAGRGKVVKIKEDLHKLAQANKAYAHYRWG